MTDTEHTGAPEPTPEQQEELDAYQRLRQRVQQLLVEVKDSLDVDSFKSSIEKASAEIKEVGEHSLDTVSKVTESLKKDAASTAEVVKPKLAALEREAEGAFEALRERGGALWGELAEQAERAVEVGADKGGSFLADVARGIGEWSQNLGDKIDTGLVYHTGEVTHGGTFTCTACGGEVVLTHPGHIPPCPKCQQTAFRRA